MPAWGWVVIGIACLLVVVLALVIGASQRRSRRLRSRFGPEYERTVRQTGSRRDAEGALREREARLSRMPIRPLSVQARESYEREWRVVQAKFVDDPVMAVIEADHLIQSVMRDRGYPVEDFERRAADLSVDHPQVVENYREGHRLAAASAGGEGAGTENLRQAMQHYRVLFDDLVVVKGYDDDLSSDHDQVKPQGGRRMVG